MKKTRITLMLIAVLAIGMMGLSGCQSITPADVQALAAQRQIIQQKVDEAQALAAKLTADMQAAGIVDPNLSAKIAKISAEADKWQIQANNIGAALQQVQLTGDANQDWIAMIRAANWASAPVNPYTLPIEGGLSVLAIILGWIAKRQADEKAKKAKALDEVVTGNDIYLKTASPEAIKAFKDAQNSTQTAPTIQAVAEIKLS